MGLYRDHWLREFDGAGDVAKVLRQIVGDLAKEKDCPGSGALVTYQSQVVMRDGDDRDSRDIMARYFAPGMFLRSPFPMSADGSIWEHAGKGGGRGRNDDE